ncbi:MAG: 30S ribosome-binding factor RbfA [Clostridia bacterium]|nr:30S ribosome-binding factor RbfA [Clostridia bacterium]
MAKYRQNRINDAVALELAVILREVKDPRVSDAMITVTAADVTPDLKYAKIYYSVLGADGDKEQLKQIYLGLKSAAGFIRSQLAKRLNMRVTPELTFVEDGSVKHGVEIAAILNSLDITPAEEEDEDEL